MRLEEVRDGWVRGTSIGVTAFFPSSSRYVLTLHRGGTSLRTPTATGTSIVCRFGEQESIYSHGFSPSIKHERNLARYLSCVTFL